MNQHIKYVRFHVLSESGGVGAIFNSPLGCLVLSSTSSLLKCGLLSLKTCINESNSIQNSHQTHAQLYNDNHLDIGLILHNLWNHPKSISFFVGHAGSQFSVCTSFLAAFISRHQIPIATGKKKKTVWRHRILGKYYRK